MLVFKKKKIRPKNYLQLQMKIEKVKKSNNFLVPK